MAGKIHRQGADEEEGGLTFFQGMNLPAASMNTLESAGGVLLHQGADDCPGVRGGAPHVEQIPEYAALFPGCDGGQVTAAERL